MKHDFSVLRAAVFLKHPFLTLQCVLLFFCFFFSYERDKCGAAAIAGFFQVFLSYFPIKEKKTFKITVIRHGSILRVTISSGIPQVICHFFLTWRSIPHPQAHTETIPNPWSSRGLEIRHFVFKIDIISIHVQHQNQMFCQEYIPSFF